MHHFGDLTPLLLFTICVSSYLLYACVLQEDPSCCENRFQFDKPPDEEKEEENERRLLQEITPQPARAKTTTYGQRAKSDNSYGQRAKTTTRDSIWVTRTGGGQFQIATTRNPRRKNLDDDPDKKPNRTSTLENGSPSTSYSTHKSLLTLPRSKALPSLPGEPHHIPASLPGENRASTASLPGTPTVNHPTQEKNSSPPFPCKYRFAPYQERLLAPFFCDTSRSVM
jgi:hypothetical protein